MKPTFHWGNPRERATVDPQYLYILSFTPRRKKFLLKGKSIFHRWCWLAPMATSRPFTCFPCARGETIHCITSQHQTRLNLCLFPLCSKCKYIGKAQYGCYLLVLSSQVKVSEAWNAVKRHSSTYWKLLCQIHFVSTFRWCFSIFIILKSWGK